MPELDRPKRRMLERRRKSQQYKLELYNELLKDEGTMRIACYSERKAEADAVAEKKEALRVKKEEAAKATAAEKNENKDDGDDQSGSGEVKFNIKGVPIN